MTVTENIIEIAAPAKTIYDLAAATDRWPLILPHYRYVRTRSQAGATRIVEMAAWRDAFPLRWVAEQTNDPVQPHIFFHHIEEPIGSGTRVTIVHRLEFQFPIAAAWLGEHVVGDYFIAGVAHKTLARMKVLAEAAQSAA
jgi:hypothetical protein